MVQSLHGTVHYTRTCLQMPGTHDTARHWSMKPFLPIAIIGAFQGTRARSLVYLGCKTHPASADAKFKA